jgi:hypothetical protein
MTCQAKSVSQKLLARNKSVSIALADTDPESHIIRCTVKFFASVNRLVCKIEVL